MVNEKRTTAPNISAYKTLSAIAIGAVVFLIFVGGWVRMTGSGMGCPDWPKCFGQWIPPTSVAELPANYQEIYRERGYANTEFNAFKTWVEYVNRLIGVLTGFFILLTALSSLRLTSSFARVKKLSFLALILVIIQGGLGAYVVRTNLEVGVISVHMMMALLILMVLIKAHVSSRDFDNIGLSIPGDAIRWGYILLGITLVQVLLGTQVREEVDILAKTLGETQRANWLTHAGWVYDIHKYFYYAVVGIMCIWIFKYKQLLLHTTSNRWLVALLAGAVGVEIALGIAMHHFAIPAWIQPLHLVLATVIIGCEYALISILVYFQKTRDLTLELTTTV